MRKIVLVFGLSIAFISANAQAEFFADEKKVTSCDIGVSELKVKVPVPAELKDYKYAALVIKVYEIGGKNPDEYGVFKVRLSKEDRASGFAEAYIIKKDGSSDFGSGLITWESEVRFVSPFSPISMKEWNQRSSRLYSSVKIVARIDKGVPTKKWDADHGVHYTEFPYEEVKTFNGSCEVKFDAPSTTYSGKNIPVSLTNKYEKGEVSMSSFDKKEINYGEQSLEYYGSIYYVNCGSREKATKHTYEFVAFPSASIDAETIKNDLMGFLYFRANKESKSASPFGAFGDFGKKIGGKKEETGNSDAKPEPSKIKWTSLLNYNIDIVLPGLYADDTKEEAAPVLKEKSPDKPVWVEKQLGGKQVWVLEGIGAYQTNILKLDGTEHLNFISVFVTVVGDQVLVGMFSADSGTYTRHDTDFTKSLLEDINKTLKFL